jgi:hypothetical protein
MMLTVVRFVRNAQPYNSGETAGFSPEKARDLVEVQGVAEYVDAPAEEAAATESVDGPGPGIEPHEGGSGTGIELQEGVASGGAPSGPSHSVQDVKPDGQNEPSPDVAAPVQEAAPGTGIEPAAETAEETVSRRRPQR